MIVQSLILRAARWLFFRSLRMMNSVGDSFVTYHSRPKSTVSLSSNVASKRYADKTAVVMQGPVAEQDEFTLNTLRRYAREDPNCQLVLSTWADTPESILDPIADVGAEIVLSEKPENPALFNVNMQLTTAAAGVKRAVEGGADWILKTRTDQRLYSPNFMCFLISLANTFPLNGVIGQRHRIIGVGPGSLIFAPYHVTDQTIFGHADDMLKYWTPPLREASKADTWGKDSLQVHLTVPRGENCRYACAESYFASQFLAQIGRPLAWTIEDSLAAMRDHFCFADPAMTDLFWQKGQLYSFRECLYEYSPLPNRQEMTFADWLQLYTGQTLPEAVQPQEYVLREPFRTVRMSGF